MRLGDAPRWVEALKSGASLALVADAGAPTVSDPGFRLVRLCKKEGVSVVPVVGVSAGHCAVCSACHAMLFLRRFLGSKTAARTFLEEHKHFPHTIIIYESVQGVGKCLDDMLTVLGEERIVCVARELTKKFETILTGPLMNVRAGVESRGICHMIAKNGFEL